MPSEVGAEGGLVADEKFRERKRRTLRECFLRSLEVRLVILKLILHRAGESLTSIRQHLSFQRSERAMNFIKQDGNCEERGKWS